MTGAMGSVDQRTRLAGHNRFEMLLFRLGQRYYGINVFKIREVIRAPRLTVVPDARPGVSGIAHVRGQTIPIIDLARAVRSKEGGCAHSVVVTEYSRSVQGFMIDGVERIVNISWGDVLSPPAHIVDQGYVTAVTRVEDRLVQILDVEKVLAEVLGDPVSTVPEVAADGAQGTRNHILVVDDSSVARNQIRRSLESLDWKITLRNNGEEALEWLGEAATSDELDTLALVISDIEMPRMDGYTLTTRIRGDERLSILPVLLHSSLSGVFNEAMVAKVGADGFLAKFNAEELSRYVAQMLKS